MAQHWHVSADCVAAAHGLTYRNVGAVARIAEITEFNIGHNIVARALFVGIEKA
jgi:pyridoxine 5-phosphate synthase